VGEEDYQKKRAMVEARHCKARAVNKGKWKLTRAKAEEGLEPNGFLRYQKPKPVPRITVAFRIHRHVE